MKLLRVLAYTFAGAFFFCLGVGVTADLMERIWGRPKSPRSAVPSPRHPPTELPRTEESNPRRSELRLAGGSTYTARTTWTAGGHP